ncbi:MAG: ferrochelatase [Alcanivoracaceae bacterium]|nr:ferrochelatase [Alcanivoracaceae bacterium]
MSKEKAAVIIVNLGTPDAPTPKAVSRYLKEFLADPRVVEVPKLIWFFILRFLVIPLRSRRVAGLYASIWQNDSPIRRITYEQAAGMEKRLGVPVRAAMTYGQPALSDVLSELQGQGYTQLVILPLYPQYSGSTNGAVADVLSKWMTKQREVPAIHLLKDYWQDDAWQNAVAESIHRYRAENGTAQKLLFSFHGIPLSYQQQGDEYGPRCLQSAADIAQRMGLEDGQWQASFQSRFGAQEWLKPYTDEVLKEWAASDVASVQVVCPGFSADCLETLEEIAVENRHYFLEAGGKEYAYIPALNSDPEHLDALAQLCQKVLPR